jgi:short-subunit dehydrogenase
VSKLRGQRAIVTGASGGVGRALAVRLAKAGVSSVLIARREEPLLETVRLVEAAGGRAIPIVGDVTSPAVRQQALDAARDELGGLDLLINNAGVGAHGRFHESNPESLRAIFELNVFAAADFIREAVPLLRNSSAACVANVGSVLGWRGVPQTAEYCASKFALRGLSESIRPELRKLGIHVLHASPSTIATDFRENLVERRNELAWSGRRGVSPEKVANRIVQGIERRQNEVAILWEDWWIARGARFVPWLFDRVLRRHG